MAFMRLVDPELRKYVKDNKLPDVYEALLSGLAIMCPEDHYQFIIDKLHYLKENGLDNLMWDMFIDEEMRPPSRIISQSNLTDIFEVDDPGNVQPELYEKAYYHYNRQLMLKALRAFLTYHLYKQHKEELLEESMEKAARHHELRKYKGVFETWKAWIEFRKGRQAVAFNQLQHIYFIYIARTVFEAWHHVTLNSKKTREYFERLERGENLDDEDESGYNNGEARDDLSRLPNKIAIRIFSYVSACDLARCARVCRSWKMLTQSTALLSRLDLGSVKHSMTDKVVAKLLSKCRPFLIHCNLRGCEKISSETFFALRECRNLQDLNLSEVHSLNDDLCKMITDGCKILLYLNLSYTNITDATLRNISVNLHNLQYLSLMHCLKFTDKGLGYLATGKGAKRLIYLDLSFCQQITANGFEKLSEGCRGLHHLVLDDLFTLDDTCVQYITANCPRLQSLSLLGSTNVSDDSFKKLAANKRLVRLKLDNNHKITDQAIKSLGKSCSELHHVSLIDCPNISDVSLKAFMSCPLTVLNLTDCVRITDSGVKYLMDGSCGLRLQELALTNCINLTDASIISIQKRGRSLAYLSLCFCSNITETGLELVGQIHSLTSVDVSGCFCTDQSLSAVGSNLHLRTVSASQCPAVTDLGLQKFAQQCTYLERLDISHCRSITDGAIKSLAFCCRLLMHLNVAGCKLLTDLSMQYLSGVCRYISFLDISGCYHITDKSLKYLKDGCSNLKTLIMLYCIGISKFRKHSSVESETQDTNLEPSLCLHFMEGRKDLCIRTADEDFARSGIMLMSGVGKISKTVSIVQHSEESVPDFFQY